MLVRSGSASKSSPRPGRRRATSGTGSSAGEAARAAASAAATTAATSETSTRSAATVATAVPPSTSAVAVTARLRACISPLVVSAFAAQRRLASSAP